MNGGVEQLYLEPDTPVGAAQARIAELRGHSPFHQVRLVTGNTGFADDAIIQVLAVARPQHAAWTIAVQVVITPCFASALAAVREWPSMDEVLAAEQADDEEDGLSGSCI